MSKQHISLLALTIGATAAVSANRFCTAGGAHAAAAGRALGVSRSKAAIGEDFPVDVIGTAVVEAGGAIAVGAEIEVGATGKAVTKAAGVTVAHALQAAAADGDFIEVLLIAN